MAVQAILAIKSFSLHF